jgi:hypothetical protein
MDRLPRVLQNEIWEYVRGDRKFWQHRQFRLVLAELTTRSASVDELYNEHYDENDNELNAEINEELKRRIVEFRQHHLNRASNLRQGLCVLVTFPNKLEVGFRRSYTVDGIKYWSANLFNGKAVVVLRRSQREFKTPGPARQDFHRSMILAAEIACGFRNF